MKLRILLVEDSDDDASLIVRWIEGAGHRVESTRVDTLHGLGSALDDPTWDVVICDWALPGLDAPRAIELVRKQGHDVPIVVVSALTSEDVVVDAMRAGAHDFVVKDRLVRLVPVIERELRDREVRAPVPAPGVADQVRLEAIGRLAGGVAHDFNNILAVIYSYTELALADLEPHLPLHAEIEASRAAAQRGANLTRQLLAFGRRQVLRTRRTCMSELIGKLSPALARVLGDSIELVTRGLDAPRWVDIDPAQIEQVVGNLAANARDAMEGPRGGRLAIELATVQVPPPRAAELAIAPGTYVVLAVSDTGAGMTPETRARVFEPFFTTKELGRGTGLGLSTVQGVVAQSGGAVEVDSAPGLGTTFRIFLRASAGVADLPIASPAIARLDGDERILVVEDDDTLRRVVGKILRRHGYGVVEIARPADAFAHCGDVDLVLTDVVMPGMSGRELGERVRALHPELEILYMTGYTDDALLRPDGELGLLLKPFTTEGLLRAVRAALDRREPRHAERADPGI